nr:MAG TPA: hypothetical protein [Caudoviricetes sp.]
MILIGHFYLSVCLSRFVPLAIFISFHYSVLYGKL